MSDPSSARRWTVAIVTGMFVAGCWRTVPCTERPEHSLCAVAEADAGTDASIADAGACAMECSGATPVCDEASGACVECVAASDCPAETPICETQTCVACATNLDCTTATASRCDANECVQCRADTDCAHLSGLGICAAGECVECTPEDETACGDNVCNVATRTCSDRAAATNPTCGRVTVGIASIARECVSDRECVAGHACVLTQFDEPPIDGVMLDIGHYCLPLATADCVPPFIQRRMLANRAGALVEVCALRLTTCPAYVAFSSTECETDTDCGVADIADGLCAPASPETPSGMACTTRCGGVGDCRTGFGCSATEPARCCFGSPCT